MNQPFASHAHLVVQGSQLPAAQETVTTNLNDVMQQVILAVQTTNRQSKPIIRFEPLPEVPGNPQKFAELFQLLFQSIVSNGSAASKPFIYLKCEQQQSEEMDLRFPANGPPHRISVYTNIAANELWLEQHCADIENMKAILNELQGSLNCSAIEKTGCLYLVTLPGKPL